MNIAQEEDRVPGKRVMVVLAGVIVITAAFVLAAWLITDCRTAELGGPGPVGTPVEGRQQIPEEVNQMELVLFDQPAPAYVQRDVKERRLHGYGWVERDAGVIHIPIERAMELYIRERQTPEESGGPAPAPGREETQEETP